MNSVRQKPLHHYKLGSGPRILLAFHGIGQDASTCFQALENTLGLHYTIFAIDLFFHGKSAGANREIVSKTYWKSILSDFLLKNNIADFDIMGFSMGGRFALATLEAFPEKIEHAYLVAPDGISENPLYTLATRNAAGRALFRWTMQKPAFFFKTIQLLTKAGIVQSSLVRFTENVLNTPEKRGTILKSWVAFRDLRFDIAQITHLAKTNNIRIFLITGEFDKLLEQSAVSPLARLLPESQNIQLKSGHTQLVAKAGVWICTLFE
ncbi:alpha/beta fold hydrolase [Dyadobacter aurulentus]|uniref:alpha/beta fold hydrolase n=1 Tax=Dyadobacter sp. UC 10 TaxID=2605428 RepID=UPI0011F105C6|nr:alpha/beta fold hydrolase [Dyadobacter sp. UC 10]KAA0990444.1 alpha/beta hydrolase [Dyadobacter sp. UC 10]